MPNSSTSLPFTLLGGLFLAGPLAATDLAHEIIAINDSPSSPHSARVLFMGHQENPHHRPASVFEQLDPVFSNNALTLTFSSNPNDLTSSNLATYDALMMYGNLRSGPGSSNQPLVTVIRDYVRGGGSLVGVHVASAAFRYDPRFSSLLGGRFQSHTVGRFTPETIQPDHILVKNLAPLDSFDETYILKDLNPDILVLQERVSGENRYPWTWVRNEEKGRVFYTASGHVPGGGSTTTYDSIIQPEFSDLILRATRWATKRHFSSMKIGGLMENGQVTGTGSMLQPEQDCFWVADQDAAESLMAEGDQINVGEASYTVIPNSANALIGCPLAGGSQVLAGSANDEAGNTLKGIWKNSDSGTVPILLEGTQIPLAPSGTTVTSLNFEIGVGFVASRSGQVLAQLEFENENSSSVSEGIFLSNQGIILEEGQSHPSLLPGVTISDLSGGGLTLNSSGRLALVAELTGGSQALVCGTAMDLALPVIEGQPIQPHSDIYWGKIAKPRISSNGQVITAVSLTGNINPQNDTALIRIQPNQENPSIILREGQELTGTGIVGDLWNSNFVVDQNGDVLMVVGLTGVVANPSGDQALIRLSSEPEVIVRRGDPLPAISPSATMGSWSENPPITLGEENFAYFRSQLLDGPESNAAIFRVEKNTIFKVLEQGDSIKLRKNTTTMISSFEDLPASGDDDGFPSASNGQSLAILVTSEYERQILLKLTGLNDLDQDGLANLVEAGTGSPPNSYSPGGTHLPKLIENSGQLSYVFLNPVIDGLPFPTIQQSGNLSQWSTLDESPDSVADQSGVPNGFQRVAIEVDRNLNQNFYRLKF